MKSKIAEAIKLKSNPVAVIWADEMPENAIHFKKGTWGCVVALIASAVKGKTAAASLETTVCPGGRAGLGFQPYEHGWIEAFLSNGNYSSAPNADTMKHSTGNGQAERHEGYKKTPELAFAFTDNLPEISAGKCLVFKPLSQVAPEEKPALVTFWVNADQMSALATLANYDRPTQDNVKLLFGGGCTQSILYPLAAEEKGEKYCYLGLTDISARKIISKDLLSFSIPYSRVLEMEKEVEGSFFEQHDWQKVAARINGAEGGEGTCLAGER